MGDGWETRRRRQPGHDWAVLELGAPGLIEEVVVDTAHFKGNYPDRFFLQAAPDAAGSPEEIGEASESWPLLLPERSSRRTISTSSRTILPISAPSASCG
jgi:allantoicase